MNTSTLDLLTRHNSEQDYQINQHRSYQAFGSQLPTNVAAADLLRDEIPSVPRHVPRARRESRWSVVIQTGVFLYLIWKISGNLRRALRLAVDAVWNWHYGANPPMSWDDDYVVIQAVGNFKGALPRASVFAAVRHCGQDPLEEQIALRQDQCGAAPQGSFG